MGCLEHLQLERSNHGGRACDLNRCGSFGESTFGALDLRSYDTSFGDSSGVNDGTAGGP